MREEGGRKRREGGERSEGRALVSSVVVTFLPDARVAMEEIAAALARNSAELKRGQKQAQKERARRRKQREHALLTATVAFCHEPGAGPSIAAATMRKYPGAMDEDLETLTREIETRFLETPADTLAQWLDWSDIPRTVESEAQRLVEDVRLLRWIGEQNSAQGVSPPPQFVWEKRCALTIDKNSGHQRCAASWRPARSAAAVKWLQRSRKTVEPVPRPSACEGGPTDGDDASEGPCEDRQKLQQWPHPSFHFGIRRAAPVWGPCASFLLKVGVQK